MLSPIERRSLSDAVYAQLRDQIVEGSLAAGSALPSERVLSEELGVNRGAVREALRKLEQARLVSVRHGGSSKVLDFRRSAGLGLLADLALTPSGEPDPAVVRSILEMRSAVGPDVAFHAATRKSEESVARLRQTLSTMQVENPKLSELQQGSLDFWSQLVDGSGNLAYRLAYNSLREVTEAFADQLAPAMEGELRDVLHLRELLDAVERGAADEARDLASELLRRSQESIGALLDSRIAAQEEAAR